MKKCLNTRNTVWKYCGNNQPRVGTGFCPPFDLTAGDWHIGLNALNYGYIGDDGTAPAIFHLDSISPYLLIKGWARRIKWSETN